MQDLKLKSAYLVFLTRSMLWSFCMNPDRPLFLRLLVGKFIRSTKFLWVYNYRPMPIEEHIRLARKIDDQEFDKNWKQYVAEDRFLESMEELR